MSGFVGPPRGSTPVPQPLSVMTNVKAKVVIGGGR